MGTGFTAFHPQATHSVHGSNVPVHHTWSRSRSPSCRGPCRSPCPSHRPQQPRRCPPCCPHCPPRSSSPPCCPCGSPRCARPPPSLDHLPWTASGQRPLAPGQSCSPGSCCCGRGGSGRGCCQGGCG